MPSALQEAGAQLPGSETPWPERAATCSPAPRSGTTRCAVGTLTAGPVQSGVPGQLGETAKRRAF